MNNDTERLARQLAEAVKSAPNGMFTLKVITAAEHILATTTPPTMADVEWDDDKHFLAEAEESSLGTVVMLMKREDGFIEVTMKPYTFPLRACTLPENLTPTGRRYTLTEVQ